MVSCDKGFIKFSGSTAELKADMTSLLEVMLEEDAINPLDVMDIMTTALKDSDVKIINGGVLDEDDLKDLLQHIDCSEEDFLDEDDADYDFDADNADEIFKRFLNKED